MIEGEPQLVRAREEQENSKTLLSNAELAMNNWQQNWETINRESSQATQAVQVETTRIDHIQRHINQQSERLQRIEEEQKTLADQSNDGELQQFKELQQGLDEKETRLQQSLEAGLESLAEQRAANAELSANQDDSREALQQARAELATLQSVQNAAYGGSNEQVVDWLKQTGLESKPRLAQNLQVDAGWEQAVESILGHFLEAVCVADESDYARKLNDLILVNIDRT